MDYKSRIKMRLEELGMEAAVASKRAGLGPTYVRDLLERAGSPRVDKLEALASALDTSLQWLLFGEGNGIPDDAIIFNNQEALALALEAVLGSYGVTVEIEDVRSAAENLKDAAQAVQSLSESERTPQSYSLAARLVSRRSDSR